MKALLCGSFALTLLAGTAFAQQPPSEPQQPDAATDQQQDAGGPPPPSPSPEGQERWDGHREGHHRPPPSKAAAFHIEAGDMRIGVKCPDDEPLKACADFTMQLLDKLGSTQRH